MELYQFIQKRNKKNSKYSLLIVTSILMLISFTGCESKEHKIKKHQEEVTKKHQQEAINLANTPPDFDYLGKPKPARSAS
ncbi:hypothetical protein [Aquirhabdus parva]|uniref:hypothetical protein n=1 Tax=Aquirhabdus parva TaxID=2283318 RepID=UPI0013B45B5A|nr:hypothetical protein [Aquirhabdus parva]